MFPQPAKNQNDKNLNNYFGNNQPAANPGSTPFAQPGVPGYNFNPYQIQTGDTFESIAQKNNMDPAQIQQANNGMLVPPPRGSMINLPYDPAMRGRGYENGMYDPRQGRGYQPPTIAQPATTSLTYDRFGNPVNGGNPGATNLAGGRGSYDATRNMMAQIQNGIVPGAVPSSMLAALGETPASMLANGFTFNEATGTWTNSNGAAPTGANSAAGGATPQSGNNWQTNDALRMITFNRNARNPQSSFTTNLKWAKNAWRRKAGKGKNRPPEQTVAADTGGVAGGTPGTVLELRLGSG